MKNLFLDIPEALDKKIKLYSTLAQGEISWIGETVLTPSGIKILDIFLIKQSTTPVNTKLNDSAYSDFIIDYVQSGKDVVNLKLWLHSHGIYDVGWSVKDEKTIETHSRADYFVSLVTNKAGQYLARVDIFKPLRITVANVIVRVIPNFTEEQLLSSQKEIKELLSFNEPQDEFVQKGRHFHESFPSRRYSPPELD